MGITLASTHQFFFLQENKSNYRLAQYSFLFTLGRDLIPGGVLPYMGHIGMCRCEGMVFKQFTVA